MSCTSEDSTATSPASGPSPGRGTRRYQRVVEDGDDRVTRRGAAVAVSSMSPSSFRSVVRPLCPRRTCLGVAILSILLLAGCGHAGSPVETASHPAGPAHPEEFRQTHQVQLPSGRTYALATPEAVHTTPSDPAPLVI